MFAFINHFRARRVARQQMAQALNLLVACAQERRALREKYGSPWHWPPSELSALSDTEAQAKAMVRALRHLI